MFCQTVLNTIFQKEDEKGEKLKFSMLEKFLCYGGLWYEDGLCGWIAGGNIPEWDLKVKE